MAAIRKANYVPDLPQNGPVLGVAPAASSGGLDILVQSQDILRIILFLDCGKSRVVCSIRCAHQCLARFTKLVYVCAVRKGLQ
jgi:hypothetical protein